MILARFVCSCAEIPIELLMNHSFLGLNSASRFLIRLRYHLFTDKQIKKFCFEMSEDIFQSMVQVEPKTDFGPRPVMNQHRSISSKSA